jgi:hypothetical protein
MIQFKLPMLVDTKIIDGGLCNLSETGQAKCSASYGKFLSFTPTWKQYTVDLIPLQAGMCPEKTPGICQETWGQTFTWDPKNVTSIQFQALASTTFDVWIDDVQFVPK